MLIEIGRKPDTNEPVYFPTPEQIGFVPHVGIFGIAGIGKTVTLKKIIAETPPYEKSFILGAQEEYRQFADETHSTLYDLYREDRGLTTNMIVNQYSQYRKSRLYVDQEDHVSQQMLFEIMKPARAKGCTVMYTSMCFEDHPSPKQSSYALAVKEMTGCFIILHPSKQDLSIVSKAFSLSEAETAFLSERINGGLIVTKSEHILFITDFPI